MMVDPDKEGQVKEDSEEVQLFASIVDRVEDIAQLTSTHRCG